MSIVDIFVTISNLHYYENSKDLKNLLHDISPFSLLWSHSKFFPLNHFFVWQMTWIFSLNFQSQNRNHMSFPPFTFRNNIFWHTNKWLNMFGNTKMSNHSLASNHSYIYSPMQRCEPGWQELCEGTKGLRRKVWTRTEISSPNIRYFVAILRFIAIYALCGNLWAKKCFFGSKTVIFCARNALWHGMYCILYWVKFAIMRKNVAYVAKIVIDENFYGHFCPRQKAANFCYPA